MAKLSMRVIVNNLNQALFVRSEHAKLIYCNNLATDIVQSICSNHFKNDNSIERYISRLGSMDNLAKNFMIDEKAKDISSKMTKDAVVMSELFLKLYMNNSDGHSINRTNQALNF